VTLLPFQPAPIFELGSIRGYVTINGVQCSFKSFSYDGNAHGATDTATVIIAIKTNPDWTAQLPTGTNAPIYANVYVGYVDEASGAAAYTLRFAGCVETYDIDEDGDETTFELRSLAMPLIANKITTPFASQQMTTIQFIQEQAARFGLGVNINVAATATLQDVLASEFVTGVRNWTIWDLMLQCAQYDDVDVWVDKSGVLNYQAAFAVDRTPISLYYGRDLRRLRGKHSPQYSKNIKVEVRSYVKRTRISTTSRIISNPAGGGVTTQTSTRTVTGEPVFGTNETVTHSISPTGQVTSTVTSLTGGASSSGFTSIASESGLEVYPVYVSGKNTQACDDLAAKMERQIAMLEYITTLSIPVTADLLPVMDITALLNVTGSRFSKLNASYWPRKLTESLDAGDGWVWEVECVNHTLPQGAV
jgi:hypothetical protein